MAYVRTQGTLLLRGDGASPEVFTSVAQISSMNPIGQTRALIDVTNLSSVAREWDLAIKDGQEIAITAQWDPDNTQHTGMRTDMTDGVRRNFQFEFPQNSPSDVIDVTALVTAWSLAVDIDQVVILNMTLKPTSDLAFS